MVDVSMIVCYVRYERSAAFLGAARWDDGGHPRLLRAPNLIPLVTIQVPVSPPPPSLTLWLESSILSLPIGDPSLLILGSEGSSKAFSGFDGIFKGKFAKTVKTWVNPKALSIPAR
jgi:hypothetical protein